MGKNTDKTELAKDFFKASKNVLKRVPAKIPSNIDATTRQGIIAIGAALLANLGLSVVNGHNNMSSGDEIAILLAIISGWFLGSIKDIRMLCEVTNNTTLQDRNNMLQTGLGGFFGGGSFAGVSLMAVKSVVAADVAITGGIASLAGAAFAIGAYKLINRNPKTKECPHCGKKGKCNQRVCRSCYKIFYPRPVVLDCKTNTLLTWEEISCYLHQQRLTYLDAEELVFDHITDWNIVYGKNNDSIFIECSSFESWTSKNRHILIDYIGVAQKKYSYPNAKKYLDKVGL